MSLFKYMVKTFSATKVKTQSDKLEVIHENGFIKLKIRDNKNAYYCTFSNYTGNLITTVKYSIGKMLNEINPIKISESEFLKVLSTI